MHIIEVFLNYDYLLLKSLLQGDLKVYNVTAVSETPTVVTRTNHVESMKFWIHKYSYLDSDIDYDEYYNIYYYFVLWSYCTSLK